MASLVASTDGLVPRPDRPSVRDKSTEVPWSVADDAFVAGMEGSLSGAALAGDAEAPGRTGRAHPTCGVPFVVNRTTQAGPGPASDRGRVNSALGTR